LPVTLVEGENSACNIIRSLRRESRAHARRFAAKPIKECTLVNVAKLQSGSNVGLGHGLVVWPFALAREQLGLVLFYRIMLRSVRCNDSETPIKTLGTATAVAVLLRHGIAACAADGMLDETPAAVVDN
jgi:hypothetical protein